MKIVIPHRLLAMDVRFWRAAFVRDEMVFLVLLVVATVGGFLAWDGILHLNHLPGYALKTPRPARRRWCNSARISCKCPIGTNSVFSH
jgi:hypothetical protein